MARPGVESAPMKIDVPTIPSLPTAAVSAALPFVIRYCSETTADTGKYAYFCPNPPSYTTRPNGS